MKRRLFFISTISCLLLLTVCCYNQRAKPLKHSFSLTSDILNEERKCLIQLPESYYESEGSEKSYPVMILLDGNSHFKTASTAVRKLASDSSGHRFMPETIIVAIENVDRERDFTVSKIKTKRHNTTGGGKRFLAFIEKELLPYLDTHYRTQPFRTLTGHSLGGLFTLNAFLLQDSSFHAYLAIDPSIWWDESTMEKKISLLSPLPTKRRLYLATANQGEANYARNKQRHDLFYQLLQRETYDQLLVKLEYFEGEDHWSIPPKAILEGLKFINRENHN